MSVRLVTVMETPACYGEHHHDVTVNEQVKKGGKYGLLPCRGRVPKGSEKAILLF